MIADQFPVINNMQLYTIFYGKSKKKMHPIKTDKIEAINFYLQSRGGASGKSGRMEQGWFKVEDAPKDAVIWSKHSSSTKDGWISKQGFNHHT